MDPKKINSLLEAQQIISEAGRMISGKNAKTLQDAFKIIQKAMETLGVLLADDDVTVEVVNPSEASSIAKINTKIPVWQIWSFDEATKILAQDDSYDARRQAVQSALRIKIQNEMLAKKVAANFVGDEYYYDYCYPHIRDLYDENVIYSVKGDLFQSTYSYSDSVVTIGDTTKVQISYVPITGTQEAQVIELSGDIIELREKAVNKDGIAQVKVISPGWGSSGYYSAEMLERDGPKVFKKGTHMYMNHPTAQEDLDRPERDLRDLVGVLTEDVKWDANGSTGPGLYAPASVFDKYRQFVDQAAPYIGTSIRASGRAQEGEAEGRYGMIIEGLIDGHSVDYVTLPGRGGAVLPLLEAQRAGDRRDSTEIISESNAEVLLGKIETDKKELEVDENQVKTLITEAMKPVLDENNTLKTQLVEANTAVARMNEGLILRDARDIVNHTLRGLDLPDMTRVRLAESCAKNPPVKDGVLDSEVLVESVKAAAIEEMKYLSTVNGVTGGKPVGVGANTEINEADTDKLIEESFARIGLTGDSLKIAAGGRN